MTDDTVLRNIAACQHFVTLIGLLPDNKRIYVEIICRN